MDLLSLVCSAALALAADVQAPAGGARPGQAPEGAPAVAPQVDWPAIWREVAAISALAPADRTRPERLRTLAAQPAARDASARGALLRATLDRLAGRSAVIAWDLSLTWPYDREEAWLAAELLPAGPERERAVIAALGSLSDADVQPALGARQVELAFQVWITAADAFRFDAALAIGRNLHARSRATWSAISLSLSLMRAGLPEEGDQILAAQIAAAAQSPADLAALWDQRGIAALGAGWERRARTDLGMALLNGSTDAAVVLARLDLAAGRIDAARLGFRGVLYENPQSDWARRGWGLSLLPPSALPTAPLQPSW